MVKSEVAVWRGVDLPIYSDASPINRLCRTYDYPADVGSLLEQVVAAVKVPGTRSIVLSGSASRGELVLAPSASGWRLFSDVELFVVGDQVVPSDRREALAQLKTIEERQWKIGARTFHTDVDFLTMRDWQSRQDRFQAWETAKAGWVLFGEDILNLVQVKVQPEATIQSSLNRLWYLLLYLPERLLRRCATEDDLQAFNYSLNRAVLDFPLWLLVHRGILVPGFSGRQKYLQEHRDEFRQQAFPIDDLMELIDAAMRSREFPELKRDVGTLFETVLGWYPRMVAWTLGLPPANDISRFPAALQKHSRELYAPLNWKRHAWQVRLMTEIGASSAPWSTLNWLRAKKEVIITTFLWQMHQAAAHYLAGRELEASESLQMASDNMGLLWPARAVTSPRAPFIDSWARLRRSFFDFIMLFYRGLRQKESYYEVVLE